MFNGRNRFNGFTTGKPVCVLRLDSGGTEVKRKNRTLKIHCNTLITKGFIPLTAAGFADLGGPESGCSGCLCSSMFRLFSRMLAEDTKLVSVPRSKPWKANGRQSNHLQVAGCPCETRTLTTYINSGAFLSVCGVFPGSSKASKQPSRGYCAEAVCGIPRLHCALSAHRPWTTGSGEPQPAGTTTGNAGPPAASTR